MNAGATSLGIKAKNGVVLATEKKLPSALIDEAAVVKISQLTPQVGCVYSGMGPDARVLVAKARKQAQAYYRTYHESVPAAQLVRETAAVMQEFTQSGCAGGVGVAGGDHALCPALVCACVMPACCAAACARSACHCWWRATTTRDRRCTRRGLGG